MGISIEVNIKTINLKVKVYTYGKILHNTKDSLNKGEEMGKASGNHLIKLMLKFIKVNMSTIKRMDMEFIDGIMDRIIKVISDKIKNMELVKHVIKMARLQCFNGLKELVLEKLIRMNGRSF